MLTRLFNMLIGLASAGLGGLVAGIGVLTLGSMVGGGEFNLIAAGLLLVIALFALAGGLAILVFGLRLLADGIRGTNKVDEELRQGLRDLFDDKRR